MNATGLDITMAVLAAEGTGGSPSVPLVDRGQRLRGQKGLGAAPKWPAKVRRRELVGGAPTARQAAEQTERHKWLDAVVSIVMEARLPAAELLGGAARGDHLRGCVGQGRRVRTLKKRVTDWRKVRSFMLKAFGEPWPRTQLDFLDYLRARADEPCARTVPASCLAALAFMEKSGNIAVGDRISGEASVKAFVEEMNLSLSGQGSSARRVAPRWPLAVAIALELAVLDKGRPVYERLLSWWLLVKLWGTLRFDDHRGLDPALLRLEGGSLLGELVRSKTSGTNKALQTLPLYIDRQAWLAESMWLQEGYALWLSHGFDRDFFLALPNADKSGLIKVEAKYADAAAMSRALLCSLRRFRVHDLGSIALVEGMLVDPYLGSYWSEHSARATLPSWAACLSAVPDAWIDSLGRWAAGKSKTYIRTYQKRVKFIQANVAKRVRGSMDPHGLLNEEMLFVEMATYIGNLGADEDRVAQAVGGFDVFHLDHAKLSLGADEEGAGMEDIVEEDAVDTCNVDELLCESDAEVSEVAEEIAIGNAFDVKKNLGVYVVSLGGKQRRRRCLHRVGSCYRVPGKDYLRFDVLSMEVPAVTEFDVMCKDCKLHSMVEVASSSASSSGSRSPTAGSSSLSS